MFWMGNTKHMKIMCRMHMQLNQHNSGIGIRIKRKWSGHVSTGLDMLGGVKNITNHFLS